MTDTGKRCWWSAQQLDAKPLSQVLKEESENPRVKENVPIKATEKELRKIQQTKFPTELQLSAQVNLIGSKKAFQALVSGLDETTEFQRLWNPRSHDPLTYLNPIGDVDVTVLLRSYRD